MKGNQKFPNQQVTSNIITGKTLPFSYRCRSNSRDHRDNSRHRSPNEFSHSNSKPYHGNSNFKPPSRNGSQNPRRSNYQKKTNDNTYNTYSNNSRPQSPHYNGDGNRSRRPLSRNRLLNVRKYINSLLDQEQTDNTTSKKANTETQNVSEEQLLEQ